MQSIPLAGAAGLFLLWIMPAVADQCSTMPRPNPVNQCGARAGDDIGVHSQIAHENGCEDLCDDNPQCRAWTYVRNERTCHLKRDVAPVQNDDCCSTGKKIN